MVLFEVKSWWHPPPHTHIAQPTLAERIIISVNQIVLSKLKRGFFIPGIAISKDGVVYFADGVNIRAINPDGTVETVIGSQDFPRNWQPLPCSGGGISASEVVTDFYLLKYRPRCYLLCKLVADTKEWGKNEPAQS